MPNALPYARLSGFYFFYYATLGAFVPYWGLYLQWRGYDPQQIGIAFSAFAGIRIFAPVLWGWCADRWQLRLPLIRTASLLAPFTFLLPQDSHGIIWLLVQMLTLSFCLNAVLPQLEVLTLNHLHGRTHQYARIRVWGSLGFVLAVLALGPLLDYLGISPLPVILASILLLMGLLSLGVPESPDHEDATGESVSLWHVIRRPVVLSLLAACFLSQISFAPYYGFFSIYLKMHGYSKTVTGILWALGVIAEIGIFLYMSRLMHRHGARRLMLMALALTAVRWAGLVAFVNVLPMLILVQCLHLASFGIYHAVAIHLIHRLFRGRLQGRGQALYSSVSFGAGGALGGLLSGHLWTAASPDWVFIGAAAAAALATLIAWVGLRGPDMDTPSHIAHLHTGAQPAIP